VIFATVGNSAFDALIAAVDSVCGKHHYETFAQIGLGRYEPKVLHWRRFLAAGDMVRSIRTARLVVCHAGAGIVGEVMRAARPMLVVPRTGNQVRWRDQGNQAEFAQVLAREFGVTVVWDLQNLGSAIGEVLSRDPADIRYRLRETNVPMLVASYLQTF
jgi:UDP-N-acetylglucosamine transferase subunit ALG13